MTARLVFAGSPDFAVPSLDALVSSEHEVVAVLSQPDRGSGRGRKPEPCAVSARAIELGLPLLQPASLRDEEAFERLERTGPDLIVVVAYGLLLPARVLALPARGCLNVHASLLPRWRGASPVQAAILAGDSNTGVSLMQMDAGLDTGPVYATRATDIRAGESAGALHARLAVLGARLLAGQLEKILAGQLIPVAQATEGVTYAPRIKKSDGLIDWNSPASQISRQVLAYDPWPVAETRMSESRLRIHAAQAIGGSTKAALPGTVLRVAKDGIHVATGDGILRLDVVQLAGRARMEASAFARGYRLPERLG